MAAKTKTLAGLGARRDRSVQEYQHDSYKLRGKLKEPTVCPECGALFHKGRWTWGTAPSTAEAASCPACHRMRDKYPKGLVTIKDIEKIQKHPNAAKDSKGRLLCGAAVGVGPDREARIQALLKAGADVIAIDTAHGHSRGVVDAVRSTKANFKGAEVVAGKTPGSTPLPTPA